MYEKDGEKFPDSIEDFKPLEFIRLASLQELDAFQDCVVRGIQPDILFKNDSVWHRQDSLSKAIMPSKFFGSIKGDIVLDEMPDPAQNLLDAYEDGVKFKKGPSKQHRQILEKSDDIAHRTRGFILSANAKSSGKPMQQIRIGLWYVPTPTEFCYGETVRRIFTEPKLEDFPEGDLQSIPAKIGQTVLRRNDILKDTNLQKFQPRKKDAR